MDRLVTVDEKLFKYGTIGEQWKQMQTERWLNPDFENFINEEIMPKPDSKPTNFQA